MLAWIRSPRGSTATATVVAVILALFWLAPWQKPLPAALRFPLGGSVDTSPAAGSAPVGGPGPAHAPAPSASEVPAPGASTLAAQPPTAVAARPPAPAETQRPDPASPPPASPAASVKAPDPEPAFDVVRVEPTGDSVIAGRAAPGSDVALLDGETVIAHAQADAGGQFAFVPPALGEGSHYLSLQTERPGQAPTRSAQGVAVSVAPRGATKPLVALLSPDKPADILSDGVSPPTGADPGAGPAKSAAPATARVPSTTQPATSGGPTSPVAIQSVQAGQNGNFLAAGVAHPGSQCRVYLNGAYLADVTAGHDGKWSVEIKKGMQPGRYTVRADELDPAGAVSHRVEVPFEYPASAMAARPAGAKRLLLSRAAQSMAKSSPTAASPGTGAAANAVVAGPHTAPETSSDRPVTEATGSRVASAAAAPRQAPAALASAASPLTSTPARAPAPPAAAVIPDLHTTTVIRGDSLWRISRKMLGHGIAYTEIYASNANQIRDPALIYPGQIFVVPNKRPNG